MESTKPADREVTAPASSLSEGDAKSRRRYSFPLLCLALWVLVIAIGIEWHNYRAGFYLPRTDWINDPGKWRTGLWKDPRDELRGVVGGPGCLQYPLALILIAWSLINHFIRRTSHSAIFNFTCAAIGLLALTLAFYRGYYTSLGW